MDFLGGFCSSASSFCQKNGQHEFEGNAPIGKHIRKRPVESDRGSLLDQLRPSVVDMGEIQFPPMVHTRQSQPRGTSAPHQRGQAAGRLQRNPLHAQATAASPPCVGVGERLDYIPIAAGSRERRAASAPLGNIPPSDGCSLPSSLKAANLNGEASALGGLDVTGVAAVTADGVLSRRHPQPPSDQMASLIEALPLATKACFLDIFRESDGPSNHVKDPKR
jgi:hypothetical protein